MIQHLVPRFGKYRLEQKDVSFQVRSISPLISQHSLFKKIENKFAKPNSCIYICNRLVSLMQTDKCEETECEIVKQEQKGREIFYSLEIDKMKEIDKWLEQFRKIWEIKFNQLDNLLATIKSKKNE